MKRRATPSLLKECHVQTTAHRAHCSTRKRPSRPKLAVLGFADQCRSRKSIFLLVDLLTFGKKSSSIMRAFENSLLTHI
ncbi:hypothetical protein BHM03_00057404 [Ensete ventricosum]|nr:hypothetical protein BHM03_00057404 [Ensete ventricosum]